MAGGSGRALAAMRFEKLGGERLQAPPQPFQLGLLDAGFGAAGIDQPPVRIVIGEQQRPRMFQPVRRQLARPSHMTAPAAMRFEKLGGERLQAPPQPFQLGLLDRS
jgi:hypothetical protein